jgi:hypothetical protein
VQSASRASAAFAAACVPQTTAQAQQQVQAHLEWCDVCKGFGDGCCCCLEGIHLVFNERIQQVDVWWPTLVAGTAATAAALSVTTQSQHVLHLSIST